MLTAHQQQSKAPQNQPRKQQQQKEIANYLVAEEKQMGAQLFIGHHSQPNPGAQVGRGHEDQDARAKNKGES